MIGENWRPEPDGRTNKNWKAENKHILNTAGYNLELEQNDGKKRAGIYVRSNIKYVRRNDLETKNAHIVICDIIAKSTIRIICLFDLKYELPNTVT